MSEESKEQILIKRETKVKAKTLARDKVKEDLERSMGVEPIKEHDLIEQHLEVIIETDGGIGLGLSPEGDGTVIHVKKGGNGETAGIRDYDMIVGYMYAEEDDEFEDFVNMATFLDFMKEADGDPIVFNVSR